MSSMVEVEEWAIQMLELMSPQMRRKLVRRILFDLRKSNAVRIRNQVGPDGAEWPKRKKKRKGRNQNKLLLGFAKQKHLKVKATRDSGSLGYRGKKANRIAAIHHFGLVDRVTSKGPKVEYPARPLLGISKQDEQQLDQRIAEHFGIA